MASRDLLGLIEQGRLPMRVPIGEYRDTHVREIVHDFPNIHISTTVNNPNNGGKGVPFPQIRRWYGPIEKCDKELVWCEKFVSAIEREPCYYIQLTRNRFTDAPNPYDSAEKERFMRCLLGAGITECEKPLEKATDLSNLPALAEQQFIVEVGPKLRYKTPWCTNVLNICTNAGLTVDRIETTYRYIVTMKRSMDKVPKVMDLLHDPVTQEIYETPIDCFYDSLAVQAPFWLEIPLIQNGISHLRVYNKNQSLGFDEQDIEYYYNLFVNKWDRNPTDIELWDLAQSNSEHSRHWFFKGQYILNGTRLTPSLMEMVKRTNKQTTNNNSVIAFSDNSSAIVGKQVPVIAAKDPGTCSKLVVKYRVKHPLMTAETHNFPTAIAPFSGAATGTGGRIRDIMAAGRGGTVIAATAGYAVGQLHLKDRPLQWEEGKENYEGLFQAPQSIIIEASNGASDYGNKFGEPVIAGFFRAFGCRIGSERREWLKPIMFSSGIGQIDSDHVRKCAIVPNENLQIAKIGGPAYRIGIGGGSASSVMIQGKSSERTINAVQRGDPEMGNKLNKFLRACIESHEDNPIKSIHDQGAGGNVMFLIPTANVLKEIVDGKGADIYVPDFTVGDNSLSVKELWCAEYQESNAIIFSKSMEPLLRKISKRERCPLDIVGEVEEKDRFRLIHCNRSEVRPVEKLPVDFRLSEILEDLPEKTYEWTSRREHSTPLQLDNIKLHDAVVRVLRLPSVASKRFLVNKVDRSVTGLVAQQQCVGPLQLPLADVAVTASSFFTLDGIATTIGEQPIMTLVNPAAGARMSLMEALASIVMAPITELKDVKCSVNWMWPAKMPGEGFAMHEACSGLCHLMKLLGVAADGGKDSLSMVAETQKADNTPDELVKAPGTVVVSAYARCKDITKIVTPDIKGIIRKLDTVLFWVRPVKYLRGRLGGSAFAQAYSQLGVNCPDFNAEDAVVFTKVFPIMQQLITDEKILACHDVSEGGFIVCLIEMCMAGNCTATITLPDLSDQESIFTGMEDTAEKLASTLFSEEIGWIVEVKSSDRKYVEKQLGFTHCFEIGTPTSTLEQILIHKSDQTKIYACELPFLRMVWEDVSSVLEMLQTNRDCVAEEYSHLGNASLPSDYRINFTTAPMDLIKLSMQLASSTPCVGILREEGTNGDREMAAGFMMAGFQVYDVTMTDLIEKKIDLRMFTGLAFPGGFSYADALGAAVGWAACIQGNEYVRNILNEWRIRSNSFSLAVCNGCQLTALLGWQEEYDKNTFYSLDKPPRVRYVRNQSERFESRWSRVKIGKSNNIFLTDMEDSVLGIWSAHGEGRLQCDEECSDALVKKHRVAMYYVDYNNEATTKYPENPNGSVGGIAGISSSCGRHLSLMPHPERCFIPWQWPEMGRYPNKISSVGTRPNQLPTAPWARIFQNAFAWCTKQKADN